MLNLFRKHATSWLIKVLLILVAIVFIFWGGYSYQSREANRLAKVYDQFITYGEYQKAYEQMVENYRRQFGKMFSEDLLKQLDVKHQALEMLIQRHLLQHAAEDLGLAASDEEVQHSILQYPVFLNEGKFEQNRYLQVLRQARMTPEIFEGQMAADLALQKVQAFIKRQASVSEDEMLAEYQFTNTQIQLSYVVFDPKDFEAHIKPEENEISTYYKDHQDKYRDPEKRQFALAIFKADQYLDQVAVTDGEIQYSYEDNQKKYHKEGQVKARHILFKVESGAPPEEEAKVRKQAEDVLAQAKKPGADFAGLAKKYSEDPGTAQKGGDLGLFSRTKMVEEFSDVAFNMKAGEISDLVQTPYGFHIIKVEEVRPEKTVSLEEARSEIEQTLKRDRARELAYKAAQNFADQAYADKDLAKVAQSKNVQVRTSAWVSQKDPIAELGASPKVTQPLFEMMRNEISRLVEAPDGFAVAQLLEIREPATQPFETVKEQVRKDLTSERAHQMAEERASELLKVAKDQKNLETAAQAQKLEAKKTGEFSRKKPDDALRLTGEAMDQVFLLTEATPFENAPLKTGNTLVVCQLLSTKVPAADAMGEERTAVRTRLLQQKQDQIWQAWLQEQRKRADVKMLHEL